MATRILFVRAVNVGGAALPMAEFRDILSYLGATDVRTYIASGNAVVDAPGDPSTFDRAVEAALTERYGWSREVMSRTRAQLVDALEAHPFEVLEPKFSYVSFLSAVPTPEAIERAREVPTKNDLWEVIREDLHIRYANGAGTPDMNTDGVMRRLGVPGTARNLNTVRKLIDLAG
jgi:uncharacterized protein (DUF1697 family)